MKTMMVLAPLGLVTLVHFDLTQSLNANAMLCSRMRRHMCVHLGQMELVQHASLRSTKLAYRKGSDFLMSGGGF